MIKNGFYQNQSKIIHFRKNSAATYDHLEGQTIASKLPSINGNI